MSIKLRKGTAGDAASCGAICYEAFKSVGTAHNFPPDFPSAEAGKELMSTLLAHPSTAQRLSQGARRAALRRFGISRFVAGWDRALRAVARAGTASVAGRS